MSIPINISGTIINFPESAQSPNWAQPVIEFAKAVEGAVAQVAGPFDIAPQVYVMTSNANTNVDLPNLAFPTSNVRGAFIRYSVFRQTTTDSVSESGTVTVTYNANGPIGNKWEIVREFVGDAQVTISITDTGEVQFSSVLLPGINHDGRWTYTAQSLLQS